MTKEEKQFTQEFLKKYPHAYIAKTDVKKHLLRKRDNKATYMIYMSAYDGPVYVLDYSDIAFNNPRDPQLLEWLESLCTSNKCYPSQLSIFPCEYAPGEQPKNSRDGCNPYWRVMLYPDIYDIEIKVKLTEKEKR